MDGVCGGIVIPGIPDGADGFSGGSGASSPPGDTAAVGVKFPSTGGVGVGVPSPSKGDSSGEGEGVPVRADKSTSVSSFSTIPSALARAIISSSVISVLCGITIVE
jgi:hypothetical protein